MADQVSSQQRWSLGLLEVSNLAPALLVTDRVAKAAGIEIIAVEGTDGTAQCIKFLGRAEDVREAGEHGERIGQEMGAQTSLVVMPGPLPETIDLASRPAFFNPLLQAYDSRFPREEPMTGSDAIGLLETQGLVAALHATDNMLKAANVQVVGKEKIGAAYVTIMIRGDVAAVQAAIEAGRGTVQQLGGTLIMADVIPRPHPELAKLLPA